MPKEIKITPRFKVKDGIQTFVLPKGYAYLRLERVKGDGTLRLIARKMPNAAKKDTKRTAQKEKKS